MADFQTQVDDLTGFASTDNVALASWLADGCKEIINVMPKDELVAVCLEEEDVIPSTGLNVRTPIIGVTRATATSNGNTYQCREISMLERYESQDEDSILYATETDPVYYLESQTSGINKVKILPVSTSALGKVTKVVYPTPAVGDSAINSFPDEYENLVVLYASVKALQRLMNDKSSSLPVAPNFTTPDSFVLPSLPSNVDIDFINAESYTLQTVFPDFTDANTWLNTEEDSEMVSSRIAIIKAQFQEYQISIQEELGKFNAEVSKAVQTYQAETGYDMSKYQAEVQTNMQKFQSDLSGNTSDFTNNLQKYSAEIQKHSTDYQWYQSQYAQLKADYQQGLQLLIGGGQAPPQQQRRQARG